MKLALCLVGAAVLLVLVLKFLSRPNSTEVAQTNVQHLPYQLAPERAFQLPPAPEWCDAAHKVPFVPADQCRGMSSCDRLSLLTMAGEPNHPIRCR